MNVDPDEYVVLKRNDVRTICLFSMNHEEADGWMDDNHMGMSTIPEFQKSMYEMGKRWFPRMYADGSVDLNMLVFGLVEEAGEVAGAMKKFLRGSLTREQWQAKMAEETVDTFHYLALIWLVLNIDAGEEYGRKTEINEARFGPKGS
jgi:NTP pyrophosphatase (non-canonical NTP hydrolase)